MSDDNLIACHVHDYIEIACLYRFEVELTLTDDRVIVARAETTRSDKNRREYLVVSRLGNLEEIEMSGIIRMRATKPNPHFDEISFA